MGQRISNEVRQEIVRKHLEEGQTIRSLAEEYFVSHTAIERWVTEFRKECQSKPELKSKGEAYEENLRLRKENAELRKENEFLKKAAAFFAKEIG